MATVLRVGHRAPRCTVLGPGTRAVLWLQGCARRCPGCIAPELWPPDGGREEPIADLADWFLGLEGVDGLTISGGEPMEQAGGLSQFVRLIRRERPAASVICFTGYAIEELLEGTSEQQSLLGLVDVLIDGPYVEERPTDLPLRGSANQRLWLLSRRHAEAEFVPAGVEVVVEPDGFYLMGIPPPGFRGRLEGLLLDKGVCLSQRAGGVADERST